MKKTMLLVAVLSMLTACLKDVNFDQGDLELSPSYNIALVHFDIPNDKIYQLQSIASVNYLEDSASLNFDKDVEEHITEVTFKYEVDNELQTGLTAVVKFLDEKEVILRTELIDIPQALNVGSPKSIKDEIKLTIEEFKALDRVSCKVEAQGTVAEGAVGHIVFKSTMNLKVKL